MSVSVSVSVSVPVYLCMCVCMYVRRWTGMYVCMDVCMYVCMRVPADMDVRKRIDVYNRLGMQMQLQKHRSPEAVAAGAEEIASRPGQDMRLLNGWEHVFSPEAEESASGQPRRSTGCACSPGIFGGHHCEDAGDEDCKETCLRCL